MSIDPIRLAGASGLIDRQTRVASTPTASNINGVTSLKQEGGDSDVFGLGKDDFFKLYLAQLKNQDPTHPMKDKIDTLEQVKSSLGGTQLAQASALIGDQVIGTDKSGLPANGIVNRIVQDSTGIMLVLEGGQLVEPADVTQVLSGTPLEAEEAASLVSDRETALTYDQEHDIFIAAEDKLLIAAGKPAGHDGAERGALPLFTHIALAEDLGLPLHAAEFKSFIVPGASQ